MHYLRTLPKVKKKTKVKKKCEQKKLNLSNVHKSLNLRNSSEKLKFKKKLI